MLKEALKYIIICFIKVESYTVGVAGLAVNQMPSGSGGSTPSLSTIFVVG